jgi:hypothetical protein
MMRLAWFAAALWCAANIAAACLPAGAGIARPLGGGWLYEDGIIYHVPHYMATPQMHAIRRDVQCCGPLSYANGPVLQSPRVYLILWGYRSTGDPDGVARILREFLGAVGSTPWLNTVTQYYGQGQQYIQNPSGMLAGVWDDERNRIPRSPTAGQLAFETQRGVNHFGYDANGSYVVATAHNHNESGFGTQWCGWHSWTFAAGKLVAFTNQPYGPDISTCGTNWIQPGPPDEPAVDEGVTIVEGHEFAESITDPHPNTGWTNATYGEIGDECAWNDIDVTAIGPYQFTTQPLFSNASDSCVEHFP